MKPTLTWRLVERWLARRVPVRSRDAVLGDLEGDYQARARAGRTAADVWLCREAGSVARAYAVHGHRRGGRARMNLGHEVKMAWRGVRARGWRALFAVALLAVAIAVNATVFSAADAFVFRTVPYTDPATLAVLDRVSVSPFGGTTGYSAPRMVEAWRQPDVFAAVHAYSSGERAHVTTGDVTEHVEAAQVTPGLFEMLGIVPSWGRPLLPGDAAAGAPRVVVIGESLARRLFGVPEAALGRTITADRSTPVVVGVMPARFRFPSAAEQIWWPLDLATWPDTSGVLTVARLAAGQSLKRAAAAVADRSPAMAEAIGAPPRHGAIRLLSLVDVRQNVAARAVFAVLLGAASCLLLIACANVASLETAAMWQKTRQLAVQSALGASRVSLVRVGLLEGLGLLAASVTTALVLAWWGTSALEQALTSSMRESLANPLDLDVRTLLYMSSMGAGVWLLTTLPATVRVSRLSVVDGLRDDPRVMPARRGAARSRQLLMTGQVALTVVLLVGALLYIRTYENRIGLDKGFDASNVVAIQVAPIPGAPLEGAALEGALLERLRLTVGVRSVARTWSLPPSTQSGGAARPTIDGRELDDVTMVHVASVDPEYLHTMGIGILAGSALVPGHPEDELVIDERFAKRFWGEDSPLGSTFKLGGVGFGNVSEFRIVGVSRPLRTDRVTTETGVEVFVAYKSLSPTAHPLTFVARLDTGVSVEALTALVRATAQRSIVRVETIDDRYANLEGDTRLAAAISGSFAVVALLVATAGMYAVMAFLVAGRRREIGIRMALGADRAAIRRLIVSAAFRFVAAGTLVGLLGAGLATRWIASQLFGVTATDPATYASVAGLVAVAAVLATWWPARRAARVDPAVTLRAE